ncbi:hypothetical protein Hamer_G013064 [Homarus americanus]|uniref:Uncharacterized protein n=1 Tax=Homarus americanus TaxID=6706 RepID=A0A8J5MXU9_HOMAM|nr:hypothetical protein Hamer_G013064 [Homarus americanus]
MQSSKAKRGSRLRGRKGNLLPKKIIKRFEELSDVSDLKEWHDGVKDTDEQSDLSNETGELSFVQVECNDKKGIKRREPQVRRAAASCSSCISDTPPTCLTFTTVSHLTTKTTPSITRTRPRCDDRRDEEKDSIKRDHVLQRIQLWMTRVPWKISVSC